jgi:hypothetical protein
MELPVSVRKILSLLFNTAQSAVAFFLQGYEEFLGEMIGRTTTG